MKKYVWEKIQKQVYQTPGYRNILSYYCPELKYFVIPGSPQSPFHYNKKQLWNILKNIEMAKNLLFVKRRYEEILTSTSYQEDQKYVQYIANHSCTFDFFDENFDMSQKFEQQKAEIELLKHQSEKITAVCNSPLPESLRPLMASPEEYRKLLENFLQNHNIADYPAYSKTFVLEQITSDLECTQAYEEESKKIYGLLPKDCP